MTNESQKNNKENSPKKSSLTALLGTASTMGMHMISGPLLGCILGYLVDKYFNTDPIGIIVGFIIGIAAGYRNVMEDAQKLQKERENLENQISKAIESDIKDNEYIEYGLFGNNKTVQFDEHGNKVIIPTDKNETQKNENE